MPNIFERIINNHYDNTYHWHVSLTVGDATKPPIIHKGDSAWVHIIIGSGSYGSSSHVVEEVLPDGSFMSAVKTPVPLGACIDIFCPGHTELQ